MTTYTLDAALNRLAKWRAIFAGWQLGTRPLTDPECQAVRDHREITLIMRAELNAFTQLCIRKGVFTHDEFREQVRREAEHYATALETKFPGMKATAEGIVMTAEAAKTMAGWKP